MASLLSVRSTLEEMSAKHLECPICTERYKRPKVLTCVHSVCEGCLATYYRTTFPEADEILCPVCRQETLLPQSGIQGLKTNFHLVALVEEFQLQEKVARSAETLCQVCSKGKEAQDRCMDCERNICKDCCETHQQFPALQTHKIVSFDDIRQGKVSVTRQPDEYKCHNHEQTIKQFYCKTCEELVCHACTVLDHPQPDHDILAIGKASKEYRDILKKDLHAFNREIQVLEISMHEINEAQNIIKETSTKARKDLHVKAAEAVAKVKAEEKRLMDEISAHERQQTEGLDEQHDRLSVMLQRKKHSMEGTKEVTRNASDMDFLGLYPVISKKVAQLRDQQTPKTKSKLLSVKFMRSQAAFNIDLGKVKMEEDKWEMCHEFGKRGQRKGEFDAARGIAAAPEPNEIAVADWMNERVVILDHRGKAKGCIRGDSRDVAAMPDGWVVGNERAVSVYKRDMTLKYEFKTVSESDCRKMRVEISSVAVMDNGNIIAGDVVRKVLTVHQRGRPGELIRTIPVRIRPDYLAVLSNGWIVISDRIQAIAEILDVSDGQNTTIITIQPQILGQSVTHCKGVCSDNLYIYLVVVSAQVSSGHIHQYDCTGQFVSCVASGLFDPRGITCTQAQQLAVADRYTIKIYHKGEVWNNNQLTVCYGAKVRKPLKS